MKSKIILVNSLTVYRILACPFIFYYLHTPYMKWIMLSAFITDILDGYLARKLKVTTTWGCRLDSFADDVLFLTALCVSWYLHKEILDNVLVLPLIGIYLVKVILLYMKHNRFVSGMHTYASKLAASFQCVFFVSCIFDSPINFVFYTAILLTMLAIAEEIIIIYFLRELRQNIKGIFFTTL